MTNVNDCTRSFSFWTAGCHDLLAPFHQRKYSQISITHSNHFIGDVDKGFLIFHAKLNLQLSIDIEKLQTIEDTKNLYKLFASFKSSNQL